ncbi:MAG TPA: THUMP domain-containing protein [bacterium]|nr:THUMP domain-containing protein [bacterium]
MTRPQLRKGRPQPRNRYLALTAVGLEPALLAEAQALGLEECRPASGAVFFNGGLEACYRANLWLRSASRVLRLLAEFDCPDDAALYREVYRLDWAGWMEVGQTLAVRVRQKAAQAMPRSLSHSQFVAQRVKDGIVDRFRDDCGRRPSVNLEHPDVQVHVYLADGRCTLSLDSSGAPLFMRGYRQGPAPAPLKETLAAGLIGLTGWQAQVPFYDFLCGTGTLAIEAALIAGRRAPGLLREDFGFLRWLDHQPSTWQAQRRQAQEAAVPVPVPILASDADGAAVAGARANARRAGVEEAITFAVREAAQFEATAGPGLILINPPYGERLGEVKHLAGFYKQLGDVLKQRAKGMEAFIFTAQSGLFKSIGLRPARRHILWNGPLECRLLHYRLY